MPKVLTVGHGAPKLGSQAPPPEDAPQSELVTLAARVAEGTATEREWARFRALAAGV